jgi:exopolysaccharide biosynthesis polyprenyl glycosylphosphotransferase
MNKKIQSFKYILFDYLAALAVWTLFYTYRKVYIEPQKLGYEIPVEFDYKFYVALIVIPLFWFIIHLLSGYYKYPYRKSRLKEIAQTFFVTMLGVLIIFFALILDDWVHTYKDYYILFLVLFFLQFFLTYIPRLILTTLTINKIQARKLWFNTLIVGSSKKAVKLFDELTDSKSTGELKPIGFVYVDEKDDYSLEEHLENLGSLNDINTIIEEYKIEEVIIAIESVEHCKIKNIITKLQGTNVMVKVIPDMYDILIGKVRMESIFGLPLIEINRNIMPVWQQHAKRFLDVVLSVIAIIILLPVYVILSIGVKLSSEGPIIYSHHRIGKAGKPFKIFKFRSMLKNAESAGPALSSANDARVTKFGRFMRKTRLDEIPQFFNVIKGEMSLVGPRPERQFFIDLIVEKAPHYAYLLTVRPGITSWGQVKYGYAENVDQMIERLKYDILYIENRSLFIDFKIMIHTIKIIFQRKGV